MTAEVRLPDDEGGRSCKTCARWDGACTHPRHSNDDPDRPCLLYRYRTQEAVEPGTECALGWKRCATCGRPRQRQEFTDMRGREWKTCSACRGARRMAKLNRQAKKLMKRKDDEI